MARSISQIQTFIISSLVTAAAAVNVAIDPTQWSNFDYRQLLTFVCAVASATVEQIFDSFIVDMEAIAAAAPPQTGPWLQNMMLNVFEYDATAVPIVQLNTTTFAPYYPDPNPAFRIITFCSVNHGAFGSTLIKLAKGTTPTALSSPELNAAASFVNEIAVPGITYTVSSGSSDKIKISATIYYKGQYAAVLAITDGTVVKAIQAYLAAIPFDGTVTLSDLEGAIKSVPGVNDVVFTNVQARANGTGFGAGTNLVIGVDGAIPTGNIIQRNWQTVAGYIVTETTSSHTINDTLFYIAQ